MHEENAQLLVEEKDAVLVLTISNPALRNALGPAIYDTGIEVVRATSADHKIGAIVLTGAGGQFCGGGNLHRLKKTREGPTSVQFDSLSKFHSWIEAIRLPETGNRGGGWRLRRRRVFVGAGLRSDCRSGQR